jgi:hypothetical protein
VGSSGVPKLEFILCAHKNTMYEADYFLGAETSAEMVWRYFPDQRLLCVKDVHYDGVTVVYI